MRTSDNLDHAKWAPVVRPLGSVRYLTAITESQMEEHLKRAALDTQIQILMIYVKGETHELRRFRRRTNPDHQIGGFVEVGIRHLPENLDLSSLTVLLRDAKIDKDVKSIMGHRVLNGDAQKIHGAYEDEPYW